jgi:hypothetical protein
LVGTPEKLPIFTINCRYRRSAVVMGLAVVPSLDAPRRLSTRTEEEDYEQELLDQHRAAQRFPAATSAWPRSRIARVRRRPAIRYGWRRSKLEQVRLAMRIMLGIQDTPGGPIRRSDVALLSRIKHSAAVVADVLADASLLEEDRAPAIVSLFTTYTAALPAPMRDELGVWLDVMRHGSTQFPGANLAPTPRSAPSCAGRRCPSCSSGPRPICRFVRSASTTSARCCRPTRWTATPRAKGCARSSESTSPGSSLSSTRQRACRRRNPRRPPRSGQPRCVARGPQLCPARHRRAGRASRLPRCPRRPALPPAPDRPARRTAGPRRTDHPAGPGGPRPAARWLDYRQTTWPHTINPHMFIHVRSAITTRPVTGW